MQIYVAVEEKSAANFAKNSQQISPTMDMIEG
jgi:hypothetical protein